VGVYHPFIAPPSCNACLIAILLHDFCAVHAPQPTPPWYSIHHTLLVMAILCKGQDGEGGVGIFPVSPLPILYGVWHTEGNCECVSQAVRRGRGKGEPELSSALGLTLPTRGFRNNGGLGLSGLGVLALPPPTPLAPGCRSTAANSHPTPRRMICPDLETLFQRRVNRLSRLR